MFDSVSRKDFEAERSLRLTAEAEATQALGQVLHLQETNLRLLNMLEEERKRHEEAMVDAMDRFAPKPKEPVPGFGVPGQPRLASYQEIMSTPAIGKRGLRERNAAAHEAKTREELEAKAEDAGGRRAVLTPAEEALVDQQIAR